MENAFLVTYALADQSLDIAITLEEMGALKVLPHTWIVRSYATAEAIFRALAPNAKGGGLVFAEISDTIVSLLPGTFSSDPIKEFLRGLKSDTAEQ